MDYQDDEPASGAAEGAKASIIDTRAPRETQNTKEAEKVKEAAPNPPADQTPATPVKKGRYGPRGPYKKREKGPDGTPVSSMKRKREGSVNAEKAAATNDKVSSDLCFLGPGFLQSLKESMANPGFTFSPKFDDTGIAEDSLKKNKTGRPPAIPEVATRSPEKTPGVIKTPIPLPSVAPKVLSAANKLPSESPYSLNESTSGPQPKKIKPTKPEPQILVPETPPSRMVSELMTTPRPAPIPFILQKKKVEGDPARAKYVISSQGSVMPLVSNQATGLTSSNLMAHKQQLQGKSKLPTRRRTVSIATSSGTSGTTPSIRDMFLRIGKPYDNPFFIEPKKPSQDIERHEESSLAVFTAAFATVRATINFTDEKEYLIEYDALVAASSGPLPCLHKLTGCNPKGEDMLRLSCEEMTSAVLKMTKTSEAEAKVTNDAIARCKMAESLLRNTIAARIPVPLGVIEGRWSLYCPGYSGMHVDKYWDGKRTLTVSETAGASKHGGVYTARLLLLPRSISFAMGDFAGPPHASFRHVGLKTVPEGYKVEIVFLGNGYAKVRLDPYLLLMGKETEKSKASSCSTGTFEFLAVHEKSVLWEKTIEGRKASTKHDG
ncbi:hypothetical protein A1F97_03856 [Pyrenophora tritici-repentis]|uniref:Uncharacterized protein n=1 Tax=Pyrenophora tritici-repentis TaxID=45151 RepID=A0A2W1F134_9PLEO|nr:hypothetical protein PtrM4_031920 [Pyrenophora tritici-repentis]PWO27983.1 RhaT, Permease of the drugmetabolite transporter (DMT) superfamily [Pyrenophora tritici-repentis]PZC97848.1 hypothetical protein A1F95_04528 [Pyrenophora tritici-repentis]PZD42159.1 hypothetical protein A1F97_03856 [Pyrenophora tritici-repentis]